jgi:starch phosphorylase
MGLTLLSSAAYAGTALAFRDRLVIEWNKTQQRHALADQKRVYCKKAKMLGDRLALANH